MAHDKTYKELVQEFLVRTLSDDAEGEETAPTEAPVVETVESESLKTKASSGSGNRETYKNLLKDLIARTLSEDAEGREVVPTEAPVVETVESESLKTKASSGSK